MDHGPQYLSDRFHNQLKNWGINFIEQPQTNGVAKSFIRTIKEQAIYGRVFQNLQEVRKAVRHFVDIDNREWLVEKNGFKSPWQARAQWLPKPHSLERLNKNCIQEIGWGIKKIPLIFN